MHPTLACLFRSRMKAAGISLRQLLDNMHDEGEEPTALSRKRRRPTTYRLLDGTVENPSFETLQRMILGLGGHLAVVWDDDTEESLEAIRVASTQPKEDSLKRRQTSFEAGLQKKSRRRKKSA